MALSDLFTRRPAAPTPPAEDPAPTVWPQIGETWKPEGVTVVQRYYNQAHAVVLVYTASKRYRYGVACLGCHYTKAPSAASDWMELSDAAEAANAHAGTCRALPRDLPARPDDDTVHKLLHTRVREHQNRVTEQEFRIDALDRARLTIQRTNPWIEAALRKLADEHPDLLLVRTSHEDSLRFFVRPYTPAS
ncbi:hypothetical protein [Streptomyces sp. NPDC008125]|uniref:hypothetical protein n=1 Tax=Streptomyces sp. NPDC008125 TaxID=3364811 RepID=UPI0036F0D567